MPSLAGLCVTGVGLHIYVELVSHVAVVALVEILEV
jgi:hypothetical protein